MKPEEKAKTWWLEHGADALLGIAIVSFTMVVAGAVVGGIACSCHYALLEAEVQAKIEIERLQTMTILAQSGYDPGHQNPELEFALAKLRAYVELKKIDTRDGVGNGFPLIQLPSTR